ncbi:MAG TPA: response regulator [Phycisphaerae bacterium]|nr:response regulator [Phycisphaerae bacterium]
MAVRHHIKVMVIDDDPSVCKTVGLLLEDHGYRPRTFTEAEKAIEAADEESCQIALVDLRMPKVDGVAVVERLREIDPRMSVLVMTAYPDLDSATETMRRGATDYIAKPFKQDELIAAVDRACQKLGLIYTSEGELNKLIGQRIRAERLRQNLTLRQLSDRTDLTTSQLSQVELGKNAASIWALARIANSLGLRVSVLLSGL